ncbi:MAG: bactofilin family protein [Paracoccaceae bacterium]
MSNSVISSDVKIEGNITGKGSIRIEGNVRGNLDFDDVFIVAGGSVTGDINAKSFTNEGNFEGNVSADEAELKVGSCSRINLKPQTLMIESSAIVVGEVNCGVPTRGPKQTSLGSTNVKQQSLNI